MTKQVRIENADTSNHKVVVQVWERGLRLNPDSPPTPDTMVKQIDLDHPAQMATEYIHSGRYITVRERDE